MDEPNEPVIAQFYIDPFVRPGEKEGGAWIDVVASRSKVLRTEKASVRLPVLPSCSHRRRQYVVH
jgi:oligopeptidase A